MKILASIVLYNPDLTRLKENIVAILPQVECLLVIDNGSRNVSYESILKEFKGIKYIKNKQNMGIAYALNQIMGFAHTRGYEWVLTLDQDSIVAPNIINVYKSILNPNLGMLGCWIEDRNFKIDETQNIKKSTIEVNWLITSASCTNVKAWKTVGGFDTNMFIDWVDWDICEAMRKAGYRIIKTYRTKLYHELGENAHIISIRGHQVYILNRPAFRYFYVFRNRIYMARKYHQISIKGQIAENFYNLLGILYFEHHKLSNLWSCLSGSIAGFFMPINTNSISQDFYNLETKEI